MKRRTLVVVAAGAVVAALAAGLAVAFGANAGGRSPEDSGGGVHSTRSPGDVASYWTGERRRNATGG
ncbi:hypothetical protein [Actinomadura sp. DC4]|uniref:hypothetical protein n=1 Tax=Actinomadura sp. DC4 TaxID=3055069 RepID=UPI0025B17B31|nr:hypothetical protein [Actinomadura sp. DC4]MDN3353704.1 hypothetical protein [Actinomadura sp. DC4]